jgi:flagella basal body P-ring formation protein FlgA
MDTCTRPLPVSLLINASRRVAAVPLVMLASACVAACLVFVAPFASAQVVAGAAATPGANVEGITGIDTDIEQQVRKLAMDASHAGKPGAPRVEIAVGQLDPRLRLAPCQHVEPYLPEGTRLWGKSRIGLRCTKGVAKWNVYLPVTVKIFGNGLVATNGISSGSVITAADVTQAEVDLAEDSSAAVASAELAVGRTALRAVQPGQSLRQSNLKARQWFTAGETVTVTAKGEGFSVASEGQALNNGVEGQPVRVQTEGGRVLVGQPVGERRVELAL